MSAKNKTIKERSSEGKLIKSQRSAVEQAWDVEKNLFRLMKKVTLDIYNCWNYLGFKGKNGYGQFWLNGKTLPAHRASYLLHIGNIDTGMFVCHKCDNRGCVNPDHLFLGTCKDNLRDMCNKGRQGRDYKWRKKGYKGDLHHSSKISDQEVARIREEYVPYKNGGDKLAKKYGISRTYLTQLIRRERRA